MHGQPVIGDDDDDERGQVKAEHPKQKRKISSVYMDSRFKANFDSIFALIKQLSSEYVMSRRRDRIF